MKTGICICIATQLLFPLLENAQARSTDSVAFFLNPEKAVVLVKEFAGARGRLQSFMSLVGADTQLVSQNQDRSIRISCVRNDREASCTFGFAPGDFTHFGDKSLKAAQSLHELNLTPVGDFEMSFESSREQRFFLKIEDGNLFITAHKRGEF